MASIESRVNKDGSVSWRVQIRRKDRVLASTFRDKETAEMWAHYKESLIDEIEAFEVPKEELVTFKDMIELKVKEAIESKTSPRYIKDLRNDMEEFSNRLGRDRFVNEISYEELFEVVKGMIGEKTKIGGTKSDITTGSPVNRSPASVRRKLASYSTCITVLQKNGLNIDNIALKIMNWLRSTYQIDPSAAQSDPA